MDAFDADVLIYAAAPDHPLGSLVLRLFSVLAVGEVAGVGSVFLLPEVLARPIRDNAAAEVDGLTSLLGHLDLRPMDRMTAQVATALAAAYGLRAADATHLATAVVAGADRFITNNSRDFPKSITEIDITYPSDLEVAE